MSPDRVAAAAAAWTWYPDDARLVETDEYLLIRFPDWFGNPLQLLRFEPVRPTMAALDEVLERSRELEAAALTAWVRLGSPEDLDDALLARGGRLDETLDVLALDLAGGVPDLAPADDLDLRWFDDVTTATDAHRVDQVVFGDSLPPPGRLVEIAAEAAADRDAGRGGRVVAYAGGELVGSAGLALADGVARLWGGGVLPEARGRGVYRALLATRLQCAADHGATMALVKGRVQTSGPILRRAGFATYGQERSYRLPL